MQDKLLFYRWLAGWSWPRSYLGKLQMVAFIGTHIPLIALVGYFVATADYHSSTGLVLLTGLLATLFSFGLTLYLQWQLLMPVTRVTDALRNYVEQGQLPTLPTDFRDEAGVLMSNTQRCVTHLDSLLKLRQNVLAIISHDLRAPLSTILLSTDLLGLQLKDATLNRAKTERAMTAIKSAVRQQEELINNTLLLVRSQLETIGVTRTAVVLPALLEKVYAETRLLAEQKGLDYQLTTADLTADPIQLDEPKLHQVLSNLVNNAIKFTPTGGSVKLGATLNPQEVIFAVSDSGIGIDAATVAALFEPFSKANRPGTENETGYGLGLWICKLLIDAQGGRIAVESRPDQGARFTIHLPYGVG